jgi:hypothetical protein
MTDRDRQPGPTIAASLTFAQGPVKRRSPSVKMG